MPASVIVLMYHSVLDDPHDCADSIGIGNIHATYVFRKQMEFLARNYNPVSLEDIRLFLSGQTAMPRKSVALTFDDGYADNFEVAAPLLTRLGIPATFYLTVDSVRTGTLPWFCHLRHSFAKTKKKSWIDLLGRSWLLEDEAARAEAFCAACESLTQLSGDSQQQALRAVERNLDAEPLVRKKNLMMTWEQARRMCQDGHVLGSHSLTHPNMTYIADKDLNYELIESKREMEDELAMPVVHFSYPAASLTGSSTRRTLAATKQAGYLTAVTTTPGLVNNGDDPLALPRIGAPRDFEEFQWVLQSVPLVLSS